MDSGVRTNTHKMIEYLTFQEFATKYPGLEREHYDALRKGKYVLRLGGKRVSIHDQSPDIRRKIGDSNESREVWRISNVIKNDRAG